MTNKISIYECWKFHFKPTLRETLNIFPNLPWKLDCFLSMSAQLNMWLPTASNKLLEIFFMYKTNF